MQKLNDTQVKQAQNFLKYYKFVYVCNGCGNIYGTDFQEIKKEKVCPFCDLKKQREKKQ